MGLGEAIQYFSNPVIPPLSSSQVASEYKVAKPTPLLLLLLRDTTSSSSPLPSPPLSSFDRVTPRLKVWGEQREKGWRYLTDMSRFIERLDRPIVLVRRYHSTDGQSAMILDDVEILIEYIYQSNDFDPTKISSKSTNSFFPNFLRVSKFLSTRRSSIVHRMDTTRKNFILKMIYHFEK